MKKISLLVGLVVVVAMLSGCMAFNHNSDSSDNDNRYNSHSGHSHH